MVPIYVDDCLRITFHMGVEAKTKSRPYLPIIGKVELRCGLLTTIDFNN